MLHFSELFHTVEILVLERKKNGKCNELFCLTRTHTHTQTHKSRDIGSQKNNNRKCNELFCFNLLRVARRCFL